MKILCFPLALWALLCACQCTSKKSAPLVDNKYSIREDRERFDDLRQNISEDLQRKNDELAVMENFFVDPKKSPTEIRERFQKLISKKRDLFNRDMNKRRESYVKYERKSREDFVKNLEGSRKESMEDKSLSRDQRREFFDNQDAKRREFFTDQREKRDEFEADFRDRRKNFEDYIKEKTDTFNQEHRAFVKRQEDERRAATAAEKK